MLGFVISCFLIYFQTLPNSLINHYYSRYHHSTFHNTHYQPSHRLQVFSYGTDWSSTWRLRQSVDEQHASLTLQGIGKRTFFFQDKLRALKDFVSQPIWQPDQVILLVDAYDTYLMAQPQHILNWFHHQPYPLVFSAEEGIWPDLHVFPLYQKVLGLRSQGGFPRAVNSGVMIGRVDAWRKLLHRWDIDNPCKDALGRSHAHEDDQRCASAMFLKHPDQIGLDTQQLLSSSLSWLENVASPRFDTNGRYINPVTHVPSMILHGNSLRGTIMLDYLIKQRARSFSTQQSSS